MGITCFRRENITDNEILLNTNDHKEIPSSKKSQNGVTTADPPIKKFKFDKIGIQNLQKNYSQHEEMKKKIDQIKVYNNNTNNPDGKFITIEDMTKEMEIHIKELENKLGEYQCNTNELPTRRTKIITMPPFQYNVGECIYHGEWNEGGLREGYGHFLDEDRRMYNGYWKNGTLVEGRIFEKDGSYYEGSIENGKAHGRGVLYFIDGTEYEGEWSDGCQIKGERRYPDGMHYKGDFKGNMYQGEGTLEWKDGSIYKGNFEKGVIEGEGTYTNSNGGIYCGSFAENRPHGTGKFIIKQTNVVYEGQYNHGTKEGNGMISNQKGDYYKGKWLNNLPHGYGEIKINNITTSGFWRHGKLFYEPGNTHWPSDFEINERFKNKKEIIYDVDLIIDSEEEKIQEEENEPLTKEISHGVWKPCGENYEIFLNWETQS